MDKINKIPTSPLAEYELGAARALNAALGMLYGAMRPAVALDTKILACVERGLEVAHITDEQGRMMPSDAELQWYDGPGWYVDQKSSNPITLPIGPFDSAAEAWSEAYTAYALGGL